MRVAVLANQRDLAPKLPGLPSDAWAELDSATTIHAVVAALASAGHDAAAFEGGLGLLTELPRFRPDLCFNLCEGHFGEGRACQVPALLEQLQLPHTGAGVLALALAQDKPSTKRVLRAEGLPTPDFQVFERADEPLDPALAFPLFVKPTREGSSIGVSRESIVHDEDQLRRRVAWLLATYRQPALVERLVEGREITVGLLGNPGRRPAPLVATRLPVVDGVGVLPAYEVLLGAFPDSGGIYTHAVKSESHIDLVPGHHYQSPAPLTPAQEGQLAALARAAFRLSGCRDVGRVDFRLDARDGDRPYILEVNPLPGLAPGWSDLSLAATAAQLTHADLVLAILAHAQERLGLM